MKKENRGPILGQIAKKFASTIGAKVVLEPEWGIVGQITFKNGKRSYFKYNTFDLNPVGSSDIAKDKDYANFFMKSMGYPIVPGGKTFYSDEWAKTIGATNRRIDNAYAYAKKLGFPVVVKPNGGSQGYGVAITHNKAEFYKAMRVAFTSDKVVLVQRPVHGKDYRIVVLDDTIVAAYERIPLNVTGDGKSTVQQLLNKKQREFKKLKRDVQIEAGDSRMKQKLKRQRLTFSSVPEKGKQVFLLDNANLSTGGDAVDVTNAIHPEFRKTAIRLTKDMGLRLCGVDLMVDGDISEKPKKYWVLEVNGGPGFDHFAKIGKQQYRIVEHLYVQMLKHLGSSK